MRIRQIKPSFWSDSHISDLAEPTRLFYIGLWMIADDAGWLPWNAREVGHDLYGYEGTKKRETKVERMLEELVKAGRVNRYPCGHVEVPTLGRHQHLAGTTKQVRTAFNEHTHCLVARPREDPPTSAGSGGTAIPANPREDPRTPAPVSKGQERSRSGTERSGQVSERASANDEASEFRAKVPLEEALAGSR